VSVPTSWASVADWIRRAAGVINDVEARTQYDKGGKDCSANPNYPRATKGDTYRVLVGGKIGGASGTTVNAGDEFFALADNNGGTQAAVGSNWRVISAASGAITSSGLTMNTNRVLGRYSASTGAVQELTLDSASLTLSNAGVLSAYGGGAVNGTVWTPLAFSGSTSTQLGVSGCNAATTTITGASNMRIEIEGYIYKVAGNAARIGISNGTDGYYMVAQGDGNCQMIRYFSGSATGLGGSGVDALSNITGFYHFRFVIHSRPSTRQAVFAEVESKRITGGSLWSDNNVGLDLVKTLTPFITTDDTTKCYARIRTFS